MSDLSQQFGNTTSINDPAQMSSILAASPTIYSSSVSGNSSTANTSYTGATMPASNSNPAQTTTQTSNTNTPSSVLSQSTTGATAQQIYPADPNGISSDSYLQLMTNMNNSLQQNNSLVDQKNAIQKQLFDQPLTQDELSKLPPDVAQVITSGNQDQMKLQLQIINDTLQGRNDSVSKSIGALTTGYENHQKDIQTALSNLMTYSVNKGVSLEQLVKAYAPVIGNDLATQLSNNLSSVTDIYNKSTLTAPTNATYGTASTTISSILGVDSTTSLSDVISTQGMDSIVSAIIQNEGSSPAGVLNNPGNIKYSGLPGQTDSGVKATDGGTFANYSTPEDGRNAISTIVQNAASGTSSSYGANPTLGSFVDAYTNTYSKALGTTGENSIDTSIPGYTTKIVVGGLTQAAIDQDALATALGGKLPVPLGLSGTGTTASERQAINNRLAEINSSGNIETNKAQLTTDTASLKTQTAYLDTVTRAFNTANDTLNALTSWMSSNNINESQFPDYNSFVNYCKAHGIDPGQAGGYNAQIATLRQEYSQVLAKGGVRSVETDAQAKALIPDGLAPADLQTVADRIKVDSDNVINDSQKQVNIIQDRINNIISPSSNSSSSDTSNDPLGIL